MQNAVTNGIVGTALNPEGIDLSGGQNVGYASDAFTKMAGTPFWFVRSGYVDGVTLYNATSNGRYWSSSASSSANAYDLSFSSGTLFPANPNTRGFGFSVRCVAR